MPPASAAAYAPADMPLLHAHADASCCRRRCHYARCLFRQSVDAPAATFCRYVIFAALCHTRTCLRALFTVAIDIFFAAPSPRAAVSLIAAAAAIRYAERIFAPDAFDAACHAAATPRSMPLLSPIFRHRDATYRCLSRYAASMTPPADCTAAIIVATRHASSPPPFFTLLRRAACRLPPRALLPYLAPVLIPLRVLPRQHAMPEATFAFAAASCHRYVTICQRCRRRDGALSPRHKRYFLAASAAAAAACCRY